MNTDDLLADTSIFLIAGQINRAMAASAATLLVQGIFYRWPDERKTAFRTNPANLPLFQLLEAGVDAAIVYARESIATLGIGAEIHGWQALTSHRHIISHPGQAEYSHKQVQKFFESDQHYLDPKLSRLWGVLASLMEWAQKTGKKVDEYRMPAIRPSSDIIDAAWSMLRHSMSDPNAIPLEAVRAKVLENFPAWEAGAQRLYRREVDTGELEGMRRAASRAPRKRVPKPNVP